MSVLDQVREKFKVPLSGTSKTRESPSAGSAGAPDRHFETCAPASAGFAGPSHRRCEPFGPARPSRRAIIAARDATPLADYREALVRGRLHLCGNCAHYTFAADPAGPGTCSTFGDGLMAFVPHPCQGFELSRPPTAPTLQPYSEPEIEL